jgi:hypothetical protein
VQPAPEVPRDPQTFVNEFCAIATLKNISSSQSHLQACGVLDVDQDGMGEYGFFGELSGRTPVRGGKEAMRPAPLSEAYGAVQGGRLVRGGYVFQIFLPDRDGKGVAEDDTGGDAANDNGVDPQAAENAWCCYAWPEQRGAGGRRTFFVDQRGDVLATDGAVLAYEGGRVAPESGAAFAGPGRLGAPLAVHAVGLDGNTWTFEQ